MYLVIHSVIYREVQYADSNIQGAFTDYNTLVVYTYKFCIVFSFESTLHTYHMFFILKLLGSLSLSWDSCTLLNKELYTLAYFSYIKE